MAQQLTEELKVFVTAEVDKAIKGLKDVDKQTKTAQTSFKVLGKTITAAFLAKEIINFSKQSVLAWENQKQAVAVLNSTITATGANAWTSSKQLQEMASSLQKITNYGDETVIQMQSVLLGFKNIKGDTFNEATKAILDMATVMKMDLSSAAQAVGKALDDPINGITSLQRQGFRFSESQKAVIQSLIDTGDTAAAQKIILDELNSTYGGAAEAAVKATTQIKNAWGDLQEGVGGFLTGFVDNEFGKKIAEVILYIADAFATFHDNVDFLKGIKSEEAFNEYYAGLTEVEDRIEAATFRTAKWQETVNELNQAIEDGNYSSKEQLETYQRMLEDAELKRDIWKDELQMQKDIIKTDQELQQKENDRVAAETKISELMHQIGLDYEKLSKDDPVIQLENYQKQLEKIAKDKETLSLNTTDIDTSKAIEQLDYNANVIRAKIKEIQAKLQDDGKKSWQQYFEKITGVSQSSFTTGKQAGELYVQGLQKAVEDSENLSELLGKKFDSKAAIENQMAELESTITNLLNIPADKINEVYTTADSSIKAMIDDYKRLNEEKKQFEVTEALEELEKRVADLGKTERQLAIETLLANGALDEQIQKANELFDKIEAAKNTDTSEDKFISWQDELQKKLTESITKLDLFSEKAKISNATLGELSTSLVVLGLNAATTGLNSLGRALAEGKEGGDALKKSLVDMASAILDQLPTLFMQAGLSLIAQGQIPLGVALLGTGIASGVVSGITDGVQANLEKNALGGVYGSENYQAFAKGGTFTNQIVTSPTLFRFAKGSGFGTGLMGEAGPEAIMPLTRTSNGSLGVLAEGKGTQVAVFFEVHNYSSEKIESKETIDEFGNKKIIMMVGSMINQHIANGKADKAISSRFGIRPQGV